MPDVSSTDEPADTLTEDLDHFYELEGERTFVYRGAHEEKTKNVIQKNWSAIHTYRKKWKFSSLYNITIRDNDVSSSLRNFDLKRILNEQINKFKVNVSIGSILINNEDESLRYFHPSAGKDRLFEKPVLITNAEDFDTFVDKLLAVDLVEYSTRSRPDTSWALHIITNINIFVYPIVNHPIGCAGRIPTHIKNSKAEEHTSELQSQFRISYAVFCLKKKKKKSIPITNLNLKTTNHRTNLSNNRYPLYH